MVQAMAIVFQAAGGGKQTYRQGSSRVGDGAAAAAAAAAAATAAAAASSSSSSSSTLLAAAAQQQPPPRQPQNLPHVQKNGRESLLSNGEKVYCQSQNISSSTTAAERKRSDDARKSGGMRDGIGARATHAEPLKRTRSKSYAILDHNSRRALKSLRELVAPDNYICRSRQSC